LAPLFVAEAPADDVGSEADGRAADCVAVADALAGECVDTARIGTRHTTLRTLSLPIRIAFPSGVQVSDSPCGSSGMATLRHGPRTDDDVHAHT
jgi:hypothetical protein